MSLPPRYARLAGHLLSEQAIDAPALPDEVRARAIDALVATMRRRKRNQRLMRALLMAAALLPIGLGLTYWMRTHYRPELTPVVATVSGEGITIATAGGLGSDGHVRDGDEIIAGPKAAATVALSTGTQLSVQPEGQVRMADGARRWQLERGRVQVAVAPMAAGETFVVETPDSRISVHGTIFSVALTAPDPACGRGARTRVNVAEGLVEVEHAGERVRLGAGESWPAGCATTETAAAKAESSAVATNSAPALEPKEPRRASTPRTMSETATSSLAIQNDIYSAAVRAKRSGDHVTALARFNELLERYPRGELAQDAEVERLRLLAQLDRTRAKAAARTYLQKYPRGSARTEAEAVLAGP